MRLIKRILVSRDTKEVRRDEKYVLPIGEKGARVPGENIKIEDGNVLANCCSP